MRFKGPVFKLLTFSLNKSNPTNFPRFLKVQKFIYTYIYLFIYLFIYSFIYLFIYLLQIIQTCIPSCHPKQSNNYILYLALIFNRLYSPPMHPQFTPQDRHQLQNRSNNASVLRYTPYLFSTLVFYVISYDCISNREIIHIQAIYIYVYTYDQIHIMSFLGMLQTYSQAWNTSAHGRSVLAR